LERITADVCVIGGGPAGSTTARRLAEFGYSVCLVEREVFPRRHVGASLPSSILPLLEVIGIREQIESAGFLRPQRIIVWWSEARPSIRLLPGPPGFHVDRGKFDQLLLQHACSRGVFVLRPAQATRPQRLSGGGWQIHLRHAGIPKEVIASFVVDASGGGTLLPGRRIRIAAPLLSLFAHWRAADRGETEGRVEAGETEWFWYAPLGDGKSVAAVFIDPKRLSRSPQEGIDGIYYDLLRRSRLFREAQAGRTEGKVEACDASSRYADQPAGADFVRVGDANLTLDPLSSQGIVNAIASGIQAAAVINTLASHPANAKAAIDFYRERQIEKIRQHAIKAAAFYDERAAVCDQQFWRQRAISSVASTTTPFEMEKLEATCRIRLSNLAKLESMPTIQANMICLAPVLRHAALDRPVAFLGEVDLVPLLRQIRPGETADSVAEGWSSRIPLDLSWKVLGWLWHRRIIVPVTD
jgi:flavin-dependent dehydrogenase